MTKKKKFTAKQVAAQKRNLSKGMIVAGLNLSKALLVRKTSFTKYELFLLEAIATNFQEILDSWDEQSEVLGFKVRKSWIKGEWPPEADLRRLCDAWPCNINLIKWKKSVLQSKLVYQGKTLKRYEVAFLAEMRNHYSTETS